MAGVAGYQAKTAILWWDRLLSVPHDFGVFVWDRCFRRVIWTQGSGYTQAIFGVEYLSAAGCEAKVEEKASRAEAP